MQLANLIVQCLLLAALIWYTVETWKIRKTSQDQIEALQKPCVSLATAPRDREEAVLGIAVEGAMIVRCPEGMAEVENVGAGPAVNMRYSFMPTNPESTRARPRGFVLGLRPGEKFLLPVPRGILQGNEWDCVFTYESLSRRRYRTRIRANDLVLTSIEFGPAAD